MASLLEEVSKHLSPSTVDEIGQVLGSDRQHTASAISAALPMLVGGLSRNTLKDPQGAQALDRALERDHDGGILDALDGMFGGSSAAGGGGVLGGILGSVLGGAFGDPTRGGTSATRTAAGSHAGGLGSTVDSILGGLGRDDRPAPSGADKSRVTRSDPTTSRATSGDDTGDLGGLLDQIRGKDGDGILGHIFGQQRDTVQSGIGKASGLGMRQVGQLLTILAPIVMAALGRIKRKQGLGPSQLTEVLDRDRQSIERAMPDTGQGGLLNLLEPDHEGNADSGDASSKIGDVLSMFRA